MAAAAQHGARGGGTESAEPLDKWKKLKLSRYSEFTARRGKQMFKIDNRSSVESHHCLSFLYICLKICNLSCLFLWHPCLCIIIVIRIASRPPDGTGYHARQILWKSSVALYRPVSRSPQPTNHALPPSLGPKTIPLQNQFMMLKRPKTKNFLVSTLSLFKVVTK